MDNNTTTIHNIEEAAFQRPLHNITIDDITLILKESIIVNNNINNSDRQADLRIDNYKIDHLIDENILYYKFFKIISNHIVAHLLRTMPLDNKPVKYTIIVGDFENRHILDEKRRRILTHLEIYLPTTRGKTIPILQQEVRSAIYAQEYTDHDWIYEEECPEMLTIIQERLTIPPQHREQMANEKQLNKGKTFKEDKCMVCIDKEPNILFCKCGHLCVCEECFDKLGDETTCIKYREINMIVRKI